MGEGKHRSVRDHLFGMAALELKLLTSTQVGELFMLQLMTDPAPPIAQIAVDQGYLTRDAVDRILAEQHKLLRRFGSEASLFGQVAIALGLMTREQVALCLAKQREGGFQRKFRDLCVEQGYLKPEQVEVVLVHQERAKRKMAAEVPVFGRIAVELGLLTNEQLEQCVEQQKAEGALRRLGEICVERGYLHQAEVQRILERQREIQVRVDSLPPPERAKEARPSAPGVVPSATATGNWAVPPGLRDGPTLAARTAGTESRAAEPSRAAVAPPQAAAGQHMRRATEPQLAAARPREGDAGAVSRLLGLVREVLATGASDIWIESGAPIHARFDGDVRATDRQGPEAVELRQLVVAALPDGARRQLELRGHTVCSLALPRGGYARCSVYTDRRGTGVALRVHPKAIASPSELGLPTAVTEVCWLPEGLVLVAGPGGSGRSTTIASLVAEIRANRPARIAAIDAQREIEHTGPGWPVSHRSVGEHVASFPEAIRAAMREAADVIAVDEADDPETVLQCLHAAEAGHLVFAGMRARSARLAIDVMRSCAGQRLGPETGKSLVASALRAVFAQQLCRSANGGRTAACEILFATPALMALVQQDRLEELGAALSAARELGMQTLNDHLVELVRAGRVAAAEAYLRTYDRFDLGQRLQEDAEGASS